MERILIAFSLTVFAGLCTVIGSCIAFFADSTNKKFLSVSLGFSAGAMIYVSMIEIFVKAQIAVVAELGAKKGNIITVVAFFSGMLLTMLIDKLVPEEANPHEIKDFNSDGSQDPKEKVKLKRVGLFIALAIGIHNFPEGLATFVSALQDVKLAIPITIAIAIHNIPEGIAVSVPIYTATGSRKKAFYYSFMSGLAEPLGALIGWVLLMPIMSDMVFGLIFAGVAGVMVFISLDELLPMAREYGEHHLTIYGLIAGMMVMATSLLLFI